MTSDDKIRRDVADELEWESGIDHRQIGIAVKDGVVTLFGESRSLPEKWMAERAAERMAGVRAVVNQMTVNIPCQCTDTDIGAAAANALTWNALVPQDRIAVAVENGVVTLSGEVDHHHERRAAEREVGVVRGVKGVVDLTTIKPRATHKDVTCDIEQALRRAALLDTQKIAVSVSNGAVTLRGSVRSWAARREAEKAAFKAPGVTSVNNLLVVT